MLNTVSVFQQYKCSAQYGTIKGINSNGLLKKSPTSLTIRCRMRPTTIVFTRSEEMFFLTCLSSFAVKSLSHNKNTIFFDFFLDVLSISFSFAILYPYFRVIIGAITYMYINVRKPKTSKSLNKKENTNIISGTLAESIIVRLFCLPSILNTAHYIFINFIIDISKSKIQEFIIVKIMKLTDFLSDFYYGISINIANQLYIKKIKI